MAKDNRAFIMDIERFVKITELKINDVRKNMAKDLFSRVIDRTPIWFSHEKHSGTAKFNWTCTIGTLSTRILKGTDQTGDITKERMKKVIDRVQGDDTIFFANSVPYIWMLEDGLYTKSPKYGSWNSQTKEYEIRSSGGYSKQAPYGIVKVALAEYPHIYKTAVREAQAKNK